MQIASSSVFYSFVATAFSAAAFLIGIQASYAQGHLTADFATQLGRIGIVVFAVSFGGAVVVGGL